MYSCKIRWFQLIFLCSLYLSIPLVSAEPPTESKLDCQLSVAGMLCLQQNQQTSEPNPQWFWQDRPLHALPTAMRLVSEFKLSLPGDFVAAISIGEDVQVLEIFTLPHWLATAGVLPDYQVHVDSGWVRLDTWTAAGLQFSSDRQLPKHLPRATKIADLTALTTQAQYRLDLQTGEVTVLSTKTGEHKTHKAINHD